MLHAVVMAGGSGTRFWPQSRRTLPKQLLRLTGERTMIQQTVDRVGSWIDADRTWIVTNRVQADETCRQLPNVPAQNVLIEPCARNTAPCVGLAALMVQAADPDGVMLVMPADHSIGSADDFQRGVDAAWGRIESDPTSLVLFGVRPTEPATGFGYIEAGELINSSARVFDVAAFREKPDLSTAQEYLASGRHYWNCGIFVWRADRILAAISEHEPEIGDRLTRLQNALGAPAWDDVLAEEFPEMKSTSIDYAVLERAQGVAVIEAPFDWDDVGSWNSLPRLLGADGNENTIDGPHCGVETTQCIVRSTDDHLIATIGLDGCTIVHTEDATLIARTQDEGMIRRLVDQLKSDGYERFL